MKSIKPLASVAVFSFGLFCMLSSVSCSKPTPYREPLRDTWMVSTLAGKPGTAGKPDGKGDVARFQEPIGIVQDLAGNLYVADKANYKIRKITPDGTVSTFSGAGTAGGGDGTFDKATFNFPCGMAIDPTSTYIYVADEGSNRIRRVTVSNGEVLTIAGNFSNNPTKPDNAIGINADIVNPQGITLDGDVLYIAETGSHRIRKISIKSPYPVTTISGGVKGMVNSSSIQAAQFSSPTGIAKFPGSDILYIADYGNNRIRQLTLLTSSVLSPFGRGFASWINGKDSSAGFNRPYALTFDPTGKILYVADYENKCIRKVLIPEMEVRTFAGGPSRPVFADGDAISQAGFSNPAGIVYDQKNNVFYVTDAGNHCIRKISYRKR